LNGQRKKTFALIFTKMEKLETVKQDLQNGVESANEAIDMLHDALLEASEVKQLTELAITLARVVSTKKAFMTALEMLNE